MTKERPFFYGIACLFALIIILYAGFALRGFRPSNNVSWLSEVDGLRFKKYGIAFIKNNNWANFSDGIISIILTVKVYQHSPNPGTIISFWDNETRGSFTINQLGSSLIVQRLQEEGAWIRPLLYSPINFNEEVTIAMTMGQKQGSRLYVNGKIVSISEKYLMNNPHITPKLIVGCLPNGRQPWEGDIYKLVIYNRIISEGEIYNYSISLVPDSQKHSVSIQTEPVVYFLFNEKQGMVAFSNTTDKVKMFIPKYYIILHKKILSFINTGWHFNELFNRDTFLNFIGFIPFTLLFTQYLITKSKVAARYIFLIVLSFGFCISLSIELIQAFIPTRSSQLTDLILNTLGGLIGICIPLFYKRFINH